MSEEKKSNATELPEVYVCIENNDATLDRQNYKSIVIRAKDETSEKAFENFCKLKEKMNEK